MCLCVFENTSATAKCVIISYEIQASARAKCTIVSWKIQVLKLNVVLRLRIKIQNYMRHSDLENTSVEARCAVTYLCVILILLEEI